MADHTSVVSVQDVAKVFVDQRGRRTPAIGQLSFRVAKGEFLAILGPSGCGKSTLLRCLSGLLSADSGSIEVNGNAVSGIPLDVAVVFQEYNRSLFPWLSVRKNIGVAVRHLPKGDANRRVDDVLTMVRLDGFGEHYPWQLSGGMQQRVAIARALACHPSVLIMDEPFASVDAFTRIQLEDMVASVCAQLSLTVIFVTHDVEEAVYMADRVLVLSERPAAVRAEFHVSLPRPRDQIITKGLAEFLDLRARALSLLLHPDGEVKES